jgi:hypothetical protein
MFASALYLVAAYASAIPYMDDWIIVKVLVGDEPLSVGWLWSPIAMHRIPITKLIKLAMWNIGGQSPRAGMLLSVLLLGAVALAFTAVARRLRGRMSYTDALFPFALLNWGPAFSLLWFWSIAFVGSTCLFCLALMILLTPNWQRRLGLTTVLGICVLLLALHATGIPYVPLLGALLAYVGLLRWRSGEVYGKRDGLVMLTFAVAACSLIALSYLDFMWGGAPRPERPSLTHVLVTTLQVASMSLGFVGGRGWPASGIVIIGLSLATTVVLASAWRKRPSDRVRVFGLFIALAATWILALGIGWVRDQGFATNYLILTVPLMCCIYFIWGMYSAPAVKRLVQMSLFTFLCAQSTYQVHLGLEYAKVRCHATESFERDIRAGTPLTGLVGRQAPYWCWDEAPLRRGLQALQGRGIGVFRLIEADPPMDELPLSVRPAALHGMTWEGGVARGVDADSCLEFSLGKPRYIFAIRMKYRLSNEEGMAQLRASWRGNDLTGPSKDKEGMLYPVKLKTGPPLKTQTIWVNDTINSFRLYPDKGPCDFLIQEMVLLVKPDAD